MRKIFILSIFLQIVLFAGNPYAHGSDHDSTMVSASDSLMLLEMAEHQQMEAVDAFPNYHPLIVHFPIVLLLMAAFFQLLSLFVLKKEVSLVTIILLGLGVISAWLASNTFHAMPGELTGRAKEIFATHEAMAEFTWWISLAALLIKIPSHFYMKQKWWMEFAATICLIGSAITVSIAGHHGSMLVHMQGVGPMGKYLDTYKPIVQPVEENTADHTTGQEDMHENSGSMDHSTMNHHRPDEAATNKANDTNHHVGELGKGPHGGTVEEAEPYHMEIVVYGSDLIFYLLDGNAKPLDIKNVTGGVKMNYANKQSKTIDLMEMNGKQTAMQAINGQAFTAICTLFRNGKSYTASFTSQKDLPKIK